MSLENVPSASAPSLSHYFNNETSVEDQIDFTTTDLTTKLILDDEDDDEEDTSSSNKNELQVCRLFTEPSTSAAPNVKVKDPTASFFDIISSNSNSSRKSNNAELISELGMPSVSTESYNSRIAIGSEVDRRRDAWIPSEQTRQCLILIASSASGSYYPERKLLTMPGVLLEEDLTDNIGEAVQLCLGEAEAAQRRVLMASDVTQDERGLRELVQAGAFRAAINLTARLLTIYGQGIGRAGHPSKHSPHSLQLWFTRIALLVKTKAFNIAQAEAEAFADLNKPDLYYQFYPEMYGGRPGSIASFSFRLLLAELSMHCGQPKKSLTKLFGLLAIVRQMLANLNLGLCEDGNPLEISDSDRSDSVKLWMAREVRIMHSIINCALAVKDYELTMDLLRQLCDREGAPKHTLLSALGRLHLQLGDVASAEVCFNEVREIRGGNVFDVREFVDKGLLSVAQNAFDEAYMAFQQASLLEPTNVMILNNMGVCLLYGGHLKEAIAVLESAISSNPVYALHESLLLNLCTLYDMESSKGRMKKFALLRQISQYQADAPTNILEKLYG